MYSLEAIVLNLSSLNSLDKLLYNAMGKICKTFDQNILRNCMFYLNCWPMKYEYYKRRITFLLKLKKSENNVIKTWFDAFGISEIELLAKNLDINMSNKSLI